MLWTFKHFFFALLCGFALHVTFAQDQEGFISIDCGRPYNSSYPEKKTQLIYVPDTNLIDSGESHSISSEYKDYYQQDLWYLRSFPQGTRNCYKMNNIRNGTKYLIRASFLYGNYDGQDTAPGFDLYLGSNFWDSIKLKDAVNSLEKEIIHVLLQNYLHVCLVNTGFGTPIISAIELRPLKLSYYKTQIGPLALVTRLDTGSHIPYRYPFDVHDRFWYSNNTYNNWSNISTSLPIESDDDTFELPSVVMSTAATPKRANDPLEFWLPDDNTTQYYVYMHFAEVQKLQPNESRQFTVSHEGKLYKPSSPDYLQSITVYSLTGLSGGQLFKISKTANSTLPPILNAYEVYAVKEFLQSETLDRDADAMTKLKSSYGIKKNSWQGDPCTRGYLWEGLNCSYAGYDPPTIIYLNLSSSGLAGEIPPFISNLSNIQILDLSNNNFTGIVPEFLSWLPELKVLHLEKNNFTGSLPVGLLQKSKDGLLSISVDENQDSCAMSLSCKKKKNKINNFFIPMVASVGGIFVLLLTASAIWWGLKRKQRDTKSTFQNGPLESVKRQFTYTEIVEITNNFDKNIGKGSFGTVYLGKLGNTQIAVKMLSESSVQGYREFLTEVQLLMRVHHRNLTSLVGYCNAKTSIGLIYEYMAKGNLQEVLSGKSTSETLNWDDRLRITMDAAQGLEYLHYGCRPLIVHRDVKTTNILLDKYMLAKLSDFGLSKTFPTDTRTHMTTGVAGTPGYLDPEYYRSYRLNEKSDVYSFGVVMLEIITGRPPFLHKFQEKMHISDWVSFMLERGDMTSIVDARLEGNFDTSSAWKAVEIAMNCVSSKPTQRPTMSQVVAELKECLATRNDNAHTNETKPLYSITELSPSAR